MPKGTPDAIVNKFNKALTKILSDPAVVKRYANIGVTVRPPEQRTREFQRKFMNRSMCVTRR